MTPEVQRLRETLSDVIELCELQLVDDPQWDAPSDTSYLSPEELLDPDIAANVQAMNVTNRLITWIGHTEEDFIGLWQGPSGREPASSPVVRLDSEGQYELLAPSVAEFLLVSVDDDDFGRVREQLMDAGFRVAESREAIWRAVEDLEDPNEFCVSQYEAAVPTRMGTPDDD